MRRIQGWALFAIILSATLAPAQSIDKAIVDLGSADVATRSKAAFQLWTTSEKDPDIVKRAVPALSQVVLDNNLNIRFMVMTTLKNIGPSAKTAVPSLIKALDTFPGGTPPLDGPQRYYADARSAAAEALGAIGPDAKDAIPALRRTLKDPSDLVRNSAAEALKKIQGGSGS